MPPEQDSNNPHSSSPTGPNSTSGQPAPPPPATAITLASQAGAKNEQAAHPAAAQIQAPSQAESQTQNHVIQSGNFQPVGSVVTSIGSSTPEPRARRSRAWLLAAIVLPAVIILAAASWLVIHKKTSTYGTSSSNKTLSTSMAIHIPADWKTVNSGLGFSVRAPSNWSASQAVRSDRNGNNLQSIEIGPATGPTDQSVIVGTQAVDGITTEAAFDHKVSTLTDQERAAAQAAGVTDPSKISVKSKSVKINGKQWLEVTPGLIFSTSLYYWQGDHAITLSVLATSQTELQGLSRDYLFPMAASLVIN